MEEDNYMLPHSLLRNILSKEMFCFVFWWGGGGSHNVLVDIVVVIQLSLLIMVNGDDDNNNQIFAYLRRHTGTLSHMPVTSSQLVYGVLLASCS